MLIGILQPGQAPDQLRGQFGDYSDLFEHLLTNHGFAFRTFDAEHLEFPEDVHQCDGWLITGSRHGVYEAHDFIAPLEAFIRDCYAESVPMAGICFGHQIIAKALGGRVEKFSGGWSIGPQDYDFNGENIRLNAWHQDQVVEIPVGAEVVGRSVFCENAALVYGDKAWTVQAHPEFSDAFIEGMLATRASAVPAPLVEAAAARIARHQPNSSEAVGNRIAEFFLKTRG